jgi:hypothetical protein
MDQKPLPPGFQSGKIQPLELPNPASFRELRPAILGTPPVSVTTRLFERRRVIIGCAVVVAFHLSLGLAWWLMPPLRLKVGIDPARWVHVVSLPPPEAKTAVLPGGGSAHVPAPSRVPAPNASDRLHPAPPRHPPKGADADNPS